MKDRINIGNGKSRYLRAASSCPDNFADFRAALLAGTLLVDVIPNNTMTGNDVGVTEIGTPLNTENVLSDSTALALGLSSTATPDDAFDRLCDKATVIVRSVTIPASWTGEAAPYTITVSVSSVTSDTLSCHPVIGIAPTATAEEFAAYASAKIIGSAQGDATLTLTAFGVKPTISIPLCVEILLGRE